VRKGEALTPPHARKRVMTEKSRGNAFIRSNYQSLSLRSSAFIAWIIGLAPPWDILSRTSSECSTDTPTKLDPERPGKEHRDSTFDPLSIAALATSSAER